MSDDYDYWGERERDFAAKPTRTTAKWTVRVWVIIGLALALALVTGSVVWVVRVGLSDAKGRGDAEVIKNEARNRIRAQEGFEKLYADIQAADQRLTLTADALARKSGGDVRLETELLGQKHFCLGLVSEYNAKARSFSQQDFRAADLPREVDQSAPTTDCEEKK